MRQLYIDESTLCLMLDSVRKEKTMDPRKIYEQLLEYNNLSEEYNNLEEEIERCL